MHREDLPPHRREKRLSNGYAVVLCGEPDLISPVKNKMFKAEQKAIKKNEILGVGNARWEYMYFFLSPNGILYLWVLIVAQLALQPLSSSTSSEDILLRKKRRWWLTLRILNFEQCSPKQTYLLLRLSVTELRRWGWQASPGVWDNLSPGAASYHNWPVEGLPAPKGGFVWCGSDLAGDMAISLLCRQLGQARWVLDLTAVFNMVDYDLLPCQCWNQSYNGCAHFSIIRDRG